MCAMQRQVLPAWRFRSSSLQSAVGDHLPRFSQDGRIEGTRKESKRLVFLFARSPAWCVFTLCGFFFSFSSKQRSSVSLCAAWFCTYHSARTWFYLFALVCLIVSVLCSFRVNCCEAKQRKAVVYLCRTIRGTKSVQTSGAETGLGRRGMVT